MRFFALSLHVCNLQKITGDIASFKHKKCWVKPTAPIMKFSIKNTETYEVSKFLLINRCATRLGREGDLTGYKDGRKICALIQTLKH